MAMSVGGSSGGPKADINITPLVDVVLVLLIIFMVVTPMMQQGIEVKLPEAKHVLNGKENSPLIITMTAAKQLYIDKDPVAEKDLTSKVAEELKAAAMAGSKRTVLLKGDRSLKFGDMRKPMDLIRKAEEQANFRDPGISLATAKQAGDAQNDPTTEGTEGANP